MSHPLPVPSNSFTGLIDAALSRRAFVRAGLGSAAVGFFGWHVGSGAADGAPPTAAAESASLPFSFRGVPVSREDRVIVPEGYRAEVLYRWGDPVDGVGPLFRQDASNPAADQETQAGMGHDGMQWFAYPGDPAEADGLLAINHEYTDQGLLTKGGLAESVTAAGVAKSQAAHGISIIAVRRDENGRWQVVPSPYSRRITARTPMTLTGPAAGTEPQQTALDPSGTMALGTFNNCASGKTPWGTYLTCEENFHGYFGTDAAGFTPTADHKAYGLQAKGQVTADGETVYGWWRFDERFDLAKHPNEANRFGYVVEIDPADPESRPIKRTALGRFKHENAAVTLAADGRVVVYLGDDQAEQHIYKFVSRDKYDPADRNANLNLLDYGTLYAARFEEDKTGRWLKLTSGHPAADADVCVRTRQAAKSAGATRMDRPEWVAVHPKTGDVFVTLTNHDTRAEANAANPRAKNIFGHIIRWSESQGDAAAEIFTWDFFLLAGDPAKDSRVTIRGDAFGSPDGLAFDSRGILWIQTDASASKMHRGDYENLGNNMMLAADPASGSVRRFLTGPRGCEITGQTLTPDLKTLFINVQHPGEPAADISDPQHPTAVSTWPDGPAAGRPRPATVAIQRTDGRPIGT